MSINKGFQMDGNESRASPCGFCCNAFVDGELRSYEDLSYKAVGNCVNGYAAYIRSGDRRKTAIVFCDHLGDRWFDAVIYAPKFCPECGRKLFENEMRLKL